MFCKINTMKHTKSESDLKVEKLVARIKLRTKNLFLTKQLMCAEAVLTVLNSGLRGGLPPEMAVRLTSGLPEGLGGSGCTCGSLTGGVLSLGLFLGRDGPGFGNGRLAMALAKNLRNQFKDRFGATCCRVLTKDLNWGSKDHFQQCSLRAGFSAEASARIILHKKPALIDQADHAFLDQFDSRIVAGLKKIANTMRS
ncbi:MAG: C-GCAxxG-C-C family protein [Proteobacteria bacterium]|nr:C-GCAxxG-C-C family protein [Pseudomonadota bacterium]